MNAQVEGLRRAGEMIAQATGAESAQWVFRAAAEIERLQDAKRRALAIADERSKENVALRAILIQIKAVCTDNADAPRNDLALKFVRDLAEKALTSSVGEPGS